MKLEKFVVKGEVLPPKKQGEVLSFVFKRSAIGLVALTVLGIIWGVVI